MKLLSLKGKNIGLLKGEFEFEFDDALTVITGPIGCGKSTILTMIRASLTNSFPGNASSWASWGITPQEACYFIASWRIGNKVLHIAKAVGGEKKFASLNIPRLRIECDDGTVEDVFGSKEGLERTHSLIPVPANIIDGHLIVDQDSITAPVSSTPAKFKEIIHTLTRTNELETIRSQVRDVLMSVVVPDVQGPLQESRSELALLEGQLNKLETDIQDLMLQYTGIGMDSVLAKLDLLDQLKKNEIKWSQLKVRRSACESSYTSLKAQLQGQESSLASMLTDKQNTSAAAELARKSLYSADMLIAANKRQEDLIIKARQLTRDLETCIDSAPVEPTHTKFTVDDQIIAIDSCNTSKQTLAFAKKRLELSKKGQCPECGTTTSLCEHDLDLLENEVDTCTSDVKVKVAEVLAIQNGIDAWHKHENAVKEYNSCVLSTMEKAQEVNAELDSLKDTPKMTTEIKQEFSKVASIYDILLKDISASENSISALKGHMQSQVDMIAGIDNEFEDIPPARYDSQEYARVTKQHQEALSIKAQVTRLDGNLDSTRQSLERAQQKVTVQETRAASVKPIEHFRRVLEKVNSVLMKDGLPRLLSLQYMQRLNDRLAFYLDTINADFTAFIDDNLEFMAKKSDGLTHSAKRLSGGQKQQASVCYLLAVNDVFASTLGVLALDEPSGAMQESNSQDLAEAFNYLAKMGHSTGRQFIVITHSTSLAAYGCKNISLEGRE